MKNIIVIMAAATLLGACGERPQTASGARQDAAPYTGTGKAFVVEGWKQGDKTSWESHLKARGLNSQNDYAKSN